MNGAKDADANEDGDDGDDNDDGNFDKGERDANACTQEWTLTGFARFWFEGFGRSGV